MHQASSEQASTHPASWKEPCLLAGFLFVFLFFVGLADSDGLLGKSLQNSAHTPTFFLGTSLLIALFRFSAITRRLSFSAVLAFAFCIALITGIAIELLQPLVGRTTSLLDLWYNLLGIGAALLIAVARKPLKQRAYVRKMLLVFAALALVSISALKPLYYLNLQGQRSEQLPILLDFEHDWQRELFSASAGSYVSVVESPVNWIGNNGNTARIDITRGRYPGILIEHIFPDWRPYQHFSFDLFSKHSKNFILGLRIDDKEHNNLHEDRFNRRLKIRPGMNKITIALEDVRTAPENRKLDLMQIEKIIIFAASPAQDFSFYLDNIRLHEAN